MADMTMCRGEGCRVRHERHRFTAVPNEQNQSWFSITPVSDPHMGCDHYIDSWFRRDTNDKRS